MKRYRTGICKKVRPVETVSKGVKKYVMDPNLCIGCGACLGILPRISYQAA